MKTIKKLLLLSLFAPIMGTVSSEPVNDGFEDVILEDVSPKEVSWVDLLQQTAKQKAAEGLSALGQHSTEYAQAIWRKTQEQAQEYGKQALSSKQMKDAIDKLRALYQTSMTEFQGAVGRAFRNTANQIHKSNILLNIAERSSSYLGFETLSKWIAAQKEKTAEDLITAIKENDVEAINDIKESQPAAFVDLNQPDKKGKTPIEQALEQGNPEIVRALLTITVPKGAASPDAIRQTEALQRVEKQLMEEELLYGGFPRRTRGDDSRSIGIQLKKNNKL